MVVAEVVVVARHGACSWPWELASSYRALLLKEVVVVEPFPNYDSICHYSFWTCQQALPLVVVVPRDLQIRHS